MGAPLIPHSHGKFMAMEKPCENLCFRISAAAMQHTHRNTNSIQQKMYLCNGNLPVSAAPRAGAIPPGTALSRAHRTVLDNPGRRGARLPAAPGLAPARRIALTTRDPAPKPGGHPALTSPNAYPMQRSYIYVCPKHIWTWRHRTHAIYMCSDSTCPQAPGHLPCPQPEGSAQKWAWHRFNHDARNPGAIDVPPKELPKPVCPTASPRLTCPPCHVDVSGGLGQRVACRTRAMPTIMFILLCNINDVKVQGNVRDQAQ